MIRSLYSAVSGLITLENKQNVIMNNMSNSNTIGFKSDNMTVSSFKDVMIKNKDKIVGNNNVEQKLGTLSLGVQIDDVYTLFTQGNFKETNKYGDFAIDGRGFFVVQNGNERKFTRDGQFKVDNAGYLVTTTGDRVLGRNNGNGRVEPIFVGNSKFLLDKENNLQVGNNKTHKLLLADFQDYNSLEKVGDNYYKGENPNYNGGITVNQGYLEISNVNAVDSMVDMMTVMRNFEANQKFVSMIDESLGKAANEVGAVR